MKKPCAFNSQNMLTAIIGLLISTTACAETTQNLIQNGEFSRGLKDWRWDVTPKAKATAIVDSIQKHSGEQSIRITSTIEPEPNVYGGLSQVVKGLQPNTTYRLTLWAKGANVANCWMGGGDGWRYRKGIPAGDFPWKQLFMDLKTGENETSLEIRVNIDGPAGSLWIDDVELLPAQAADSARMYAPTVQPSIPPGARFFPAPSANSQLKAPVVSFRDQKDRRFGADVQINWSDNGVRLLLNVLDPTPGEVQLGDSMWRGDSVQIAFDTDPQTPKSGGYTETCVEAGFGLSSSGKVEGHCFYAADPDKFDLQAVQAIGKRTTTGYMLDLMIPWKNFNLASAPAMLGLNVLVNDSQVNGIRRSLEWTPGIGEKKMPDEFICVVPVPAGQSSAAFILLDQKKYTSTEIIAGTYYDYSFQPQCQSSLTLDIFSPSQQVQMLDGLAATLPATSAGGVREIKFTIPARLLAAEGVYTFNANLKNTSGAMDKVASRKTLREDLATRVAQQLPDIQARFAQIQARIAATPAVASDEYLKMGVALADRFLKRVVARGPDGKQSQAWSLLQLRELSIVLDRLEQRHERLTHGTAPVPAAQSLMGQVRQRDGLLWIDSSDQPAYLYGYGHFSQVVRDIPNFPALGASLIQQEIGPNQILTADGVISGSYAEWTRKKLAGAYAGQIRVDLLLSQHYFPKWAYDKVPEVKLPQNYGFIRYDIDHPYTRQILETYLRNALPMLRESPALLSICLSNEPVFTQSGRTPSSAARWTEYLKERYGAIAAVNAAYQTSFESLEEVPVPPAKRPSDMSGRRMYFDWIVFNQRNFAQWHRWLNGIVKSEVPNIPTHIKVMNTIFDAGVLHYGTDPELLCAITDFAGNDAFTSFTEGGKYAYAWQQEEIWYDLLHSFRGQPVFNSENHFIPDATPPVSIAPAFTRSVFWQGALHHQAATTLWVWEEPMEHDLEGSIYLRPANIYTTSQAFFDLRRHADKVAQISRQKARVALLYSIPSIYWQPDYTRTLQRTYATLQFLGQPVTFLSEKQLAGGQRSPANDQVQVLILPHATHVTPEALKGIQKFAAAGGKVICIGDECLAYDDLSRAAATPVVGKIQLPIPADESAAAAALRPALRRAGLTIHDLLLAGTTTPATGVEYRVVPAADGSTLISMVNFSRNPLQVTLPVTNAGVDLLDDSCAINPRSVELQPMEPRLVQTKH